MSHVCMCADPACKINGCKILRDNANQSQHPQWPGSLPPMYPIPTQDKGCICPPGSEKTCQRLDCGRKTYSAYPVTYNTSVSASVSIPQLLVEDDKVANT